jgi:UDPglucose 6-dehydrogenase
MTEMCSVSVVGMGKLGLCLAACFAKRGLETIAVDIEEKLVNFVNQGRSPTIEPGLPQLISQLHGTRLKASLSHKEAIDKTDITFVLVATPSSPDGSFSNKYVESALESLARALGASKKKYHIFVISSTVVPGSTEGFIPLIEKYSGRKLNEGFGVCFNPDFVALGEVIEGFLRPELVVIGESSRAAGDAVEAVHRSVCENQPHIARMSIMSAEIAKMALNSYITVKISFANMLANICEKIPNADIDAITKAVGVDKRISPHYFQGGLGYGGTCFPRDTKAFIALARRYGNGAELIKSAQRVNELQDEHLVELVLQHLPALGEKAIGVLGLSFKPNTPEVTESPGIKLINELLKRDLPIVVYDPLAIDNTRAIFNDKIQYVSSAKECLARSSLCVITTKLNEFKSAAESYVPTDSLTIIDCWRILDRSKLQTEIKYVAWGYAQEMESLAEELVLLSA